MSGTIALGGDVMLGRGVAAALAEQPPADVWSPELRDVFGEADIALVCGRLAHYGIAARHLRSFRTAADREAGLIEQVVGPALRARNPERRRSGAEDLEALAALAAELSQLLSWRALRRLAST